MKGVAVLEIEKYQEDKLLRIKSHQASQEAIWKRVPVRTYNNLVRLIQMR